MICSVIAPPNHPTMYIWFSLNRATKFLPYKTVRYVLVMSLVINKLSNANCWTIHIADDFSVQSRHAGELTYRVDSRTSVIGIQGSCLPSWPAVRICSSVSSSLLLVSILEGATYRVQPIDARLIDRLQMRFEEIVLSIAHARQDLSRCGDCLVKSSLFARALPRSAKYQLL